jgi:hypothetical protein
MRAWKHLVLERDEHNEISVQESLLFFKSSEEMEELNAKND